MGKREIGEGGEEERKEGVRVGGEEVSSNRYNASILIHF